MSTEVPSSAVEKPAAAPVVAMTNRRQALLFVALTLILTIATVWGGRIWLNHSETLIFATRDTAGVEAGFADKLAAVRESNKSAPPPRAVATVRTAKQFTPFGRR